MKSRLVSLRAHTPPGVTSPALSRYLPVLRILFRPSLCRLILVVGPAASHLPSNRPPQRRKLFFGQALEFCLVPLPPFVFYSLLFFHGAQRGTFGGQTSRVIPHIAPFSFLLNFSRSPLSAGSPLEFAPLALGRPNGAHSGAPVDVKGADSPLPPVDGILAGLDRYQHRTFAHTTSPTPPSPSTLNPPDTFSVFRGLPERTYPLLPRVARLISLGFAH